MPLSPLVSFLSRFVTYLLTFPRILLRHDWNLPVTNKNQRTFNSRFGQGFQYEKVRLNYTADTRFPAALISGESERGLVIFGILCQNHAASYFK
jgi:hypothetical protein